MARKINYTSNLIYLTHQVRCLSANLELPVDGALFGEFLDRELHFLSVTIGRIHRALQESSFAQDRLQFIIDLRAVSVLFVDLLDRILQGRVPIADYLAAHAPRYARMLASQREVTAEIESHLSELINKPGDGTYIVSEEEYMHLLSEDEE